MTLNEIIDQVIQVLKSSVDSCREANIDENTRLIETGLLDSFAVVSLLPDLENSFRIDFPIEELEIDRFGSPKEIGTMIGELLP